MSFRLSHSSYGKYVTCPRSFKFHYIDKIRPTSTPSALIFGSALDAGINSMLSKVGDPIEACDSHLEKLLQPDTEFMKSDFDAELFDEENKKKLQKLCERIAGRKLDLDVLIPYLLNERQGNMSEKQHRVLATCCMETLKIKARLMLDAYNRTVVPLIKKVNSTQKFISWKDEKNNEFTGVLDIEVELDGHGSLPADNKTASRPYEADAVEKSTQLAIYAKVTGKNKAAFFVMDKNIKKNRVKVCKVCGFDGSAGRHKTCANENSEGKRCGGEWEETIQPEASIQVLVGDVPERVQQLTQEALTDTAEAIKKEVFPRNLNACDNQFGRPCPYREYCWKGDKTGLRKF